jgi:YD repeat-containing protein
LSFQVLTKRTLQDNQDTFVIEDGNEDGIGATFNDKGQLVAFIDGEGNQYQITLNLNGSLKFISFPDGTNKSYSYLQNGHSIMTQTGAIKRFEYNQDRKLAMKDIGNGSINTYSYDTFGRIQNILNENANIVVSNENDKITQFAYPDHSINYTYNENNQITSIFTSSGYVVKYEYNDNGHIHYVKDKENRILLTADYTESGQVSKKILGNNATTIYKYDPVTGLLLDMLNYFPNGSVSSYFKYKYSVRNRRISVETHEGVWKFGYDRAGQVVSMIDPKGTRTEYSYDKSKNRKIISINGIEQNTVVNELNQYIKYGNTNFAYDKNGNLIRRNGTDEEYYTFDEDNKLVSFKTGTYNCRLKYDGLDNLYSKHCNGTTTRYVVNPLGNFGSDLIIKVSQATENVLRN